MTGKLIVVADGFYGSCGKGHVTEMLLNSDDSLVQANVRVGGPNAGHIVYGPQCPSWCGIGDEGPSDVPWGAEPEEDHLVVGGIRLHPWKLRQVPVGAVVNHYCKLVIAAGSEIHLPTLHEEIKALEDAGHRVINRLYIDSAATVLTERHKEQEKHRDLTGKLGSTAKGIGAARADRIWRTAETWGEHVKDHNDSQWTTDNTADYLYQLMSRAGGTVIIEGTQGFGLGLHTENYPQVTSTDCRAVDFLAQAGLSPWHKAVEKFEPWVVLRTRPIRVAGNSGPMKGETTWEEIGLRPEKTTVTRKVRRVGEFDAGLANRAIDANGGHNVARVALTMVDHVIPELAGADFIEDLTPEVVTRLKGFIEDIEIKLSGQVISWVGTGPDTGLWLVDEKGDRLPW
jgi:adenylosuccinate synthase